MSGGEIFAIIFVILLIIAIVVVGVIFYLREEHKRKKPPVTPPQSTPSPGSDDLRGLTGPNGGETGPNAGMTGPTGPFTASPDNDSSVIWTREFVVTNPLVGITGYFLRLRAQQANPCTNQVFQHLPTYSNNQGVTGTNVLFSPNIPGNPDQRVITVTNSNPNQILVEQPTSSGATISFSWLYNPNRRTWCIQEQSNICLMYDAGSVVLRPLPANFDTTPDPKFRWVNKPLPNCPNLS